MPVYDVQAELLDVMLAMLLQLRIQSVIIVPLQESIVNEVLAVVRDSRFTTILGQAVQDLRGFRFGTESLDGTFASLEQLVVD